MPDEKCSEADFIKLFEENGARKTGQILDLEERTVYARRARIENRLGHQLTAPGRTPGTRHNIKYPQRVELEIEDGIVLVASDAHYWPGDPSPAHRCFLKFLKDIKPVAVIMNGDSVDGASISSHPPLGWENLPTVVEEIGAVQRRLAEIIDLTPDIPHIWPMGNHDSRFAMRLARVAPEYANVHGIQLRDHFPDWEPCWSVWINSTGPEPVVVKHRWKGGTGATRANTLNSGVTMVTGHLHSLKVTPLTDLLQTRWGVDTGTLAEPMGPQFLYSEDNPRDWRSGFAVLTFKDGELLWPEVVFVDGDQATFRGKRFDV